MHLRLHIALCANFAIDCQVLDVHGVRPPSTSIQDKEAVPSKQPVHEAELLVGHYQLKATDLFNRERLCLPEGPLLAPLSGH
eukprot:5612431-Amphidinium_carterae.2